MGTVEDESQTKCSDQSFELPLGTPNTLEAQYFGRVEMTFGTNVQCKIHMEALKRSNEQHHNNRFLDFNFNVNFEHI